jgi:hypothetical protein
MHWKHQVVRRRDDGVLDMMMAHLQVRKTVVDGMFKRAIPVAQIRCPLRDPRSVVAHRRHRVVVKHGVTTTLSVAAYLCDMPMPGRVRVAVGS